MTKLEELKAAAVAAYEAYVAARGAYEYALSDAYYAEPKKTKKE